MVKLGLSHGSLASLLAAGSYLGFTCMDGVVQVLITRRVPLEHIFTLRMATNVALYLVYYLLWDTNTIKTILSPAWSTGLFWIRACTSAAAQGCVYASLAHLTLSEFLTLFHLRPFVVAFLCWCFLGEKSSSRQLTASIISFAAVILVVQPEWIYPGDIEPNLDENAGQGASTALGLLFTAGAVTSNSLDVMLCRKLGDTFDPHAMLFGYVCVGSIVGVLWIAAGRSHLALDISASSASLILLVTALGLVSQLTIVAALQRTTGTIVALIGYSQISFSAILQGILFSNEPSTLQMLGMFIIMTAGVWCMCEPLSMEEGMRDEIEEDLLPRTSSLHCPSETLLVTVHEE